MILPDFVLKELEETRNYLIKYNDADEEISLEFWKCNDIDIVESGFYELSERLNIFDIINIEKYPYGFFLVTLIFNWESQRSSEGLLVAFINMKNISNNFFIELIKCYKYIKLEEEAKAIELAYFTFLSNPENENNINKAYKSVENEYSKDYERIPYIVEYLIKESNRLFYLNEEN